jgi:hypothetical protein
LTVTWEHYRPIVTLYAVDATRRALSAGAWQPPAARKGQHLLRMGRGVKATGVAGARTRVVAAALVLVLGVLMFAGADAFATGALQSSASNNLTQAQVVTITGTGFAANSYGYVLECNETPGEPSVPVGPPFDTYIPIGCSAPNLKHIVSTTATGSLTTTFAVHLSRRLGPPCSPSSVLGPCGQADSGGKRPRGDAMNYPCPPSPAQQAAKVSCALVFYDTAHEVVSTPITFLGGGPATKPGPGGGGGGGGGGSPGSSPPTTAAPVPVTTTPITPGRPGPVPTPVPATPPVGVPSTSSRGGGSSGGPGPSLSTTPAHAVSASSGSLAFTGLGTGGQIVAFVGLALVLIGFVLMFANLRRLSLWLLGR